MGYELRGFDPGPAAPNGGSGQLAENDKHFTNYQYMDTSGSLTIGMPVYCLVTDAAEFNTAYSSTALSPAAQNSGGQVVLGTNAGATNLVCVGVYAPENPAAKPAKGEAIRVLDRGIGLVSACAKTAGTAVLVGDFLVADSSQTSALSGHNTPVTGKTIGQALATGSAVTSGASIIAVPGSGSTTQLINARIKLT